MNINLSMAQHKGGKQRNKQKVFKDVLEEGGKKLNAAQYLCVVIRLDVTRDLPCCPQGASHILLELPLHLLPMETAMHKVSVSPLEARYCDSMP
ncbi:hypothetical protein BaRGS_00023456 [Batillaria attramentaria]|uniref:Uncharacterized protein n=1 Tax=Batillaria attramentaria TaxID=370345 RepID=A0ABD0KEC2_9CAEN